MEGKDYKQIIEEKEKQIRSLRERLQESESECKRAKTYYYRAQSQFDQIYGLAKGLQEEGSFTYSKAYSFAGCFTPGDLENIHIIVESQFKEIKDWLENTKINQLKSKKLLRDYEHKFRNYVYDARDKLNYMYDKLLIVHGSNPRPRYHHFYDLEDLHKISDSLENQFEEMLKLVDKTVLLKTTIDEKIDDLVTELNEQKLEIERLERQQGRIRDTTISTYIRKYH